MSSKKAQGISINTIIIAAIALIVLVVLVMVFTGRISIFGKGVDSVFKGGKCVDTCFTNKEGGNLKGIIQNTACSKGYSQQFGKFSDLGENQVCCVQDTGSATAGGC